MALTRSELSTGVLSRNVHEIIQKSIEAHALWTSNDDDESYDDGDEHGGSYDGDVRPSVQH